MLYSLTCLPVGRDCLIRSRISSSLGSQFLFQGPLEEQVIEDYMVLISLIFLLLLTQRFLGDNFFPFQILFPVQVFMSRQP